MPYIAPARRVELDALIEEVVAGVAPVPPGDLNYVLTRMAIAWVRSRGESYATLALAQGVLHGVAAEFDRRMVAPYEDGKIAENGDVYPPLSGIVAP